MRYATNSVTTGNRSIVGDICAFLRTVYAQYQQLGTVLPHGNGPYKELGKKMEVWMQSLVKIETRQSIAHRHKDVRLVRRRNQLAASHVIRAVFACLQSPTSCTSAAPRFRTLACCPPCCCKRCREADTTITSATTEEKDEAGAETRSESCPHLLLCSVAARIQRFLRIECLAHDQCSCSTALLVATAIACSGTAAVSASAQRGSARTCKHRRIQRKI